LNLLKTQSSKFKKRHYQKYYDCLSNWIIIIWN
jgi:hypothetical protein